MDPSAPSPLELQARINQLESTLAEAATIFTESLTALEIQLADEAEGWIPITGTAATIDLPIVRTVAQRLYLSYHGNPLTRRAIDITTAFVWGRGVNMTSPQKEVQETITDFLEEPTNAAELGHVGRMEKEKTARIQGQLFLALPTNPANGEVRVRTVALEEIDTVLTDPNDYRQVTFIARIMPDDKGTIVYHPALGYNPASKPATKDGHKILWNAPILYAPLARVCRELYALPDLASTLVWSKTYTRFLSNIASINAALAQIALLATGKSPSSVAALAAIFSTGSSAPAIPTASTAILPDGSSITPFKTAGMTTSAAEGRPYMLNVCAGAGVPEHIEMGDPSTGNLATSKTMERPYELTVLDRQLWWADILERILYYVVEMRAMAEGCTAIKGRKEKNAFDREALIIIGATRIVQRKAKPRTPPAPLPGEKPPGEIPPPAAEANTEPPGDAEEPLTKTADEPPEINVEFPSVLEHDMVQEVTAIIDAVTIGGKKPAGIADYPTIQKALLSALNMPDVDDLIANMDQADIDEQRNPPTPPGLAGLPGQKKPGEKPGEEPEEEPPEKAAPPLFGDAWRGLIHALEGVEEAARGEA